MYNENRKLQFIEEEKTRNQQLERNITLLFKRIEAEEASREKDLCEFSLKEILEVYKQSGTSSLETLMMTNSYYRIYTDWCLKNGYVPDGQNHYSELNYDLIHNECVNLWIKDKQIFTKEDVIKICTKLDNPGDKFIVLGLFEGICGVRCRELANVRISDVRGNELTTFDNRKLIISDTLVNYIKDACCEYEYIPYKKNGVRARLFYDETDDRAVKRMYNGSTDESDNGWRTRVGSRLRRINEMQLIDIGTKSLLASGVIDYVNNNRKPNQTPYDFIHDSDNKAIIEYRWMRIASVKRFCLKYENFFK